MQLQIIVLSTMKSCTTCYDRCVY